MATHKHVGLEACLTLSPEKTHALVSDEPWSTRARVYDSPEGAVLGEFESLCCMKNTVQKYSSDAYLTKYRATPLRQKLKDICELYKLLLYMNQSADMIFIKLCNN